MRISVNPNHNLQRCCLKIDFNIIIPYIHADIFFLQDFRPKCMCDPFYPYSLDHLRNFWRGSQSVKFHIIQFYHLSFSYFLLLGQYVPFSFLFCQIFRLDSSLNVKYQVWNSYKTTSEIARCIF